MMSDLPLPKPWGALPMPWDAAKALGWVVSGGEMRPRDIAKALCTEYASWPAAKDQVSRVGQLGPHQMLVWG